MSNGHVINLRELALRSPTFQVDAVDRLNNITSLTVKFEVTDNVPPVISMVNRRPSISAGTILKLNYSTVDEKSGSESISATLDGQRSVAKCSLKGCRSTCGWT